MTHAATIAVLPVGEFDAEVARSQFESKLTALEHFGSRLFVADPLSSQDEAQSVVATLAANRPDLLVIIALRGSSAQAQEAAARLSPAPCLLWPIDSRYGLPSSALAAGALREDHIPVELLYGPPDHPTTLSRLQCVTRAATAFTRLRRCRIGVVGGLFPNLVSCRYDPQVINARIGATLIPIRYPALRNLIQPAAQPSHPAITADFDVAAADQGALQAGLSLHQALKQVAQEQALDGFAAECWTGLPKELGLNPCLGFIEDAYALACEGDVMLCLSLLLVRYLTGGSAYVGDLYDLDLDGQMTLIHCGAPASLAASKSEVVLTRSQLALERGFGTVTCRPRLASGPVTLFRFYGQGCDQLHMASAQLLGSEQSPNLTVKVKLNGSRWDFLDHCLGNHYLVAAGDLRPELALLAKWLGITVFET